MTLTCLAAGYLFLFYIVLFECTLKPNTGHWQTEHVVDQEEQLLLDLWDSKKKKKTKKKQKKH